MRSKLACRKDKRREPAADAGIRKTSFPGIVTAGGGTCGGGDTVSALNHAGVSDDMTFVSTAGGAFLEWMEGKPLPGVEALQA